MSAGNFTHSTQAVADFFTVVGNITNSGVAGYTGMKVNITENSLGTGISNLLDLQVASASKFVVSNAGFIGIGVQRPTYDISFGNTGSHIISVESTANTVSGKDLFVKAGSST